MDKVLLQAPGVTQDSAASGLLHVRNEHANVQYRINGIILPDGVSGFGQVLQSEFHQQRLSHHRRAAGRIRLRTSGLVDIQTKSGAENPGGNISLYGGSQQTLTPTIQYGGVVGQTDISAPAAISQATKASKTRHRASCRFTMIPTRVRAFGYVTSFLSPTTRLSFITGSSVQHFEIPNSPGQIPMFPAFGVTDFNSSLLNENQLEQNYYDVLALQGKTGDTNYQLAYFSRYSDLHFMPDRVGDIIFNGVASNVERQSFVNGVQGDGSYPFNADNTLRSGFYVSGERTAADNFSTVLPVDAAGDPIDAPFNVTDNLSKVGWLLGAYVQDEWKLTDKAHAERRHSFRSNVPVHRRKSVQPARQSGLQAVRRHDHHAGYARYFTPPSQVLAGPTDLAIVQNTTIAPAINQDSPVLPERSHYFDAGITQRLMPGLELGIDGYYKRAQDLLDDGQFGAALVLDGFNYAKAFNDGIEVKATYQQGGFKAYGNIAVAEQKATDIVSNQFCSTRRVRLHRQSLHLHGSRPD